VSGYDPYGGHAPHVGRSETNLASATFQDASGTRARDELKVLRLAAERGDDGLTDDEIEVATGMLHQTASARRRCLELKGCLRATGRKRPTRRQKPAGVYVLTTVGRAELEDRNRALAEGRPHRPKRKEVAS
jgi:hypothetical protein